MFGSRKLNPAVGDAVLALCLIGVGVLQLGVTPFPDPRGFDLGGFWAHFFLVAIIAPIAVRRRYPWAAFAVSTAAAVTAAFVGVIDTSTEALGHGVVMYTAVARSGLRGTLLAALGAAAVLLTHVPPWIDGIVPAFAYNVIYYALVLAAGRVHREGEDLAASIEASNAALARERELLAEQALDAERRHIAAELERVVAHAMNRARAQVARARSALAGPAEQRDAALTGVEDVGREALADVQRLVSLLRAPDRESPAAHASPERPGRTVRIPGTVNLWSALLVPVAALALWLELDDFAGRVPPGTPTALDDTWFLIACAIAIAALLARGAVPRLAAGLVAAMILFGRFEEPMVTTTTILTVQIVVTYTLASLCAPRVALAGVILGSVVWLVGVEGFRQITALLLFELITLGFAAVLGFAVRRRRRLISALEERGAELRRAQEDRARMVVEQERTRVAREMHDSVGHALTLMVLQAGVARRHAGRETDVAAEALDDVERLAGKVGEELGALRDDTPPDVEDLPMLVGDVVASGMDVQLDVGGKPRPLGGGLEATLYRITQEALTNAHKHARGAPASVQLRYGTDSVELAVLNEAAREPHGEQLPSGGNGLIAIRERVAVFGGEAWVGPRPEGGFEIRVRIPADV